MEKYDKLKRKLKIESCIMVAVMLVLGATIYFIGSISDDYAEKNADLQKKVDAIDLETKTLRGKFANIQKNLEDYNELQKKLTENRLAINRQLILEKFNDLKTQYLLNNLHLEVTQAQDLKGAMFMHPNYGVNYSLVTAKFEVLNDETIYQLMDSLRYELPGVCKLITMNVTFLNPIDKEALRILSTQGTFSAVRAEIQFIWFGINYTAPHGTPQPGAPNAPKS